MSDRFLPSGATFTSDDIVVYANPDERSLDEAIAEADVLITAPHAGDKVPTELERFLPTDFTQRLQFDFTDCSTRPVGERWARIDPRVIYVGNPHPRLVRDPNRAKPHDIETTLREAFARVRAAGPGRFANLSGVDAIRPVNFAFLPVLTEPPDDAHWESLIHALTQSAAHGLDVYQSTRQRLLEQMVDASFKAARDTGRPQMFTTLGLHDTMNHTVTPDGAVASERPEQEQLPSIVTLSNRGDAEGEARGSEPVSMRPDLMRLLAQAHRDGFAAQNPGDVELNRPYLGGYETITAGAWMTVRANEAAKAGVVLGAVQAEFRREFLLGESATAELMTPGDGWPTIPPERIERLAHASRASWDLFRGAAAMLNVTR